MHYWRNFRLPNEIETGQGATRPPLESGANTSDPVALFDRSWSRPLNDGYEGGFSEPEANLPSGDFNFWRWIKWYAYGLPELNANPSSPGMEKPVWLDQRELAKREYIPQPSRPNYIGAEGMTDFGGKVLVCGTCGPSGEPSHPQLFTASAFQFAQQGGGLTIEVRVISPTPHNYDGKTIKCVCNGSTYELPVGFVGRDWKTLDTFTDVTSFDFVEQSSV